MRERIIGSQGTLWPQNEKVIGAKQCPNTVPLPLITSTLLVPMLMSVSNVTEYLVSFSLVRAHDTPGLTALPMTLGGTTNPWVSCRGSQVSYAEWFTVASVQDSLALIITSLVVFNLIPSPSSCGRVWAIAIGSFTTHSQCSRTQSGRGSYPFKLSLQLTYLILLQFENLNIPLIILSPYLWLCVGFLFW